MTKSTARKPRRAAANENKSPPTRTAVRKELRRLARRFADELLQALDDSGLFEAHASHSADDAPKRKRLRRSDDALSSVTHRLLAALRKRKSPVAISELAAALGTSNREIAHPLSMLVSQGRVLRTGERRGARYQLIETETNASAKRSRGTQIPASRRKGATRKSSRPVKRKSR